MHFLVGLLLLGTVLLDIPASAQGFDNAAEPVKDEKIVNSDAPLLQGAT